MTPIIPIIIGSVGLGIIIGAVAMAWFLPFALNDVGDPDQ